MRCTYRRILYFTLLWKWRNWYHNEVDEEIKGVGSRDKVKHNERSDKLFLERMMSLYQRRFMVNLLKNCS